VRRIIELLEPHEGLPVSEPVSATPLRPKSPVAQRAVPPPAKPAPPKTKPPAPEVTPTPPPAPPPAQKQPPPQPPPPREEDDDGIKVGDRVLVNGTKVGTVRFIGDTKIKPGTK
jgi:hypothetical protein